jgi:hypothetical protein
MPLQAATTALLDEHRLLSLGEALLHLRQRGSLTWILLGRYRLDGDTLVLNVQNRKTDLIWKRD